MSYTIEVKNPSGELMAMEVEGGKVEVLAAMAECVKELEIGGRIWLKDGDGNVMSSATKPRP